MKPIPKSLHTVTVLVAVARELRQFFPGIETTDAVARALRVLGYADTADTYGLAEKARAILAKESARALKVAA